MTSTIQTRAERLMLAVAAALLLAAMVLHTMAYSRATTALDATALPAFFVGAFKSLWLIDSVMCGVLGVLYLAVAWKPALGVRAAMALLALMPALTAGIIYAIVGNFFAAHVLLAAAALALAAAWPRQTIPERPTDRDD